MTTENPLIGYSNLPAFDRIKPEHIMPAVDNLCREVEAIVEGLEKVGKGSDWAPLQDALNEIDHLVHKVWSPVQHLQGVSNSESLRKAYDAALPKIVALELRVSQSQGIFAALTALHQGSAWEALSAPQRRILDLQIQSAQLQGVGLKGAARERFNEIKNELSQLASKYSNNVLDSVKAYALTLTLPAEVKGLPVHALQLASQEYNRHKKESEQVSTPEGGPWRVTLDQPSLHPFLKFAERRDLREKLYRADQATASTGTFDNGPLIKMLLQLRQEEAKILGFVNYAEMSLSRKMAGSVAKAKGLLEELLSVSYQHGLKEMDELRQFAKKKGVDYDLTDWDLSYWAERLKEERYSYSEEELLPYFPMAKVLSGLFALLEKIFEVKIIAADGKAAIWNKDVRFFQVLDQDSKPIAAFFLDPFARPESKRGGAWMAECVERRRVKGQLSLPVAHLVCNGTPQVGDKPSLLTFMQVRTLFHEFGHGLQHMLTKVDFPQVAGIRGVEWDAVELPSQFMENWVYHVPTLLSLTSHVETGAVLPQVYIDKLLASRNFRSAYQMLRQLQFGLTDLDIHSTFDPKGTKTVFDVYNETLLRTNALPPRPENRFLCSFSHIFAGGYSAGYYSYKWAEVLSADAFAAFEEVGLDRPEEVARVGRKFRDTVMSEGGSRHPLEVFRAFRGREPTTAALLKHSGM